MRYPVGQMEPRHLALALVLALLLPRCDAGGPADEADGDSDGDMDSDSDSDTDADSDSDTDADHGRPDADPEAAADAESGDAVTDDADRPGADAEVDARDADVDDLPPLRDDGLEPNYRWDERAQRVIDPDALAAAFARVGYSLPTGTEVYAVQVVDGAAGPAYVLYEAGDGAFSQGFWPASTIKVLAALGALDYAASMGFTGAARITFETGFADTLRAICDRAIRVSSNADYDWTVRVAGFDRLNDEFLTVERGFPSVVIQRSYTGEGVRRSPAMTIEEGARNEHVPARDGIGADRCPPRDGNCTNLFELTEGLRRLVLHDEVPAAERFDIAAADVAALTDAICGSTSSEIEPGAERVFGPGLRVCNKTGTVMGDDYLDHGLVEVSATGARYLVALAVPEQGSYTTSVEAATTVAEQVLRALASFAGGLPIQPDSGVPIVVQLDDHGTTGGRRSYTITVEAHGADHVEVWAGRWRLGETAGPGPRFSLSYDFSSGGERLLSIRASRDGAPVGFRSLRVRITEP